MCERVSFENVYCDVRCISNELLLHRCIDTYQLPMRYDGRRKSWRPKFFFSLFVLFWNRLVCIQNETHGKPHMMTISHIKLFGRNVDGESRSKDSPKTKYDQLAVTFFDIFRFNALMQVDFIVLYGLRENRHQCRHRHSSDNLAFQTKWFFFLFPH